jgi:hypothetical protein
MSYPNKVAPFSVSIALWSFNGYTQSSYFMFALC